MKIMQFSQIRALVVSILLTCICISAQSPQELKQTAIVTLGNISSGDPSLEKNIDKAIASIQKSLVLKEQSLFLDGFRISSKSGAKVFANSSKAVNFLLKVIADDNTPQPIKDAVQQVVDSLVLSDKQLTELAIQITQTMNGVLEINDKLLQGATQKFAEALQEPRSNKAINLFKSAWILAQKALSKKLKGIEILSFEDAPDPFVSAEEQNTLSATVRVENPQDLQFVDFVQVIKDASKTTVRTLTQPKIIH